MVSANPEHGPTSHMEKLTPFLEETYSSSELRRVTKIYQEGRALEPMPSNCRVVVNMPVYYMEKNLNHALRQYVNQDARQKGAEFELAVYINGPSGVDIEKTIPYEQAMAFQREQPGVRIVSSSRGRIRKNKRIFREFAKTLL